MKRPILVSFLVSCVVIFLGLLFLARGPEQDLTFYRVVPSEIQVDRLERNILATTRWPQWFHALEKVTFLPATQTTLALGCILNLRIDSHKAFKKPFDLEFEVTEFDPSHKIVLKLLKDSSGKLTRLFDRLEWRLEWEPEPSKNSRYKSRVTGVVTAHTQHWKGRFFGRISEKILMNQVFYPDLVKLVELRQPFSAEIPTKSVLSGM